MSLQALQEYTFVSKYANYSPHLQRRETWDEAIDRVEAMHVTQYPDANVHSEIRWAFEQVREKLLNDPARGG